jgi:hypothetical protein
MRKSSLFASAATVAAFAGIAFGAVGTTAHAATFAASRTVTATTQLHNRPDGGGNGTWAYDTFSRTLQLHYLGKSADPSHAAAPYMYWAQINDKGTFKDMPGAFTPDQGGADAGKVLRPTQVTGPMSGEGQWGLFYSSARAHSALVPVSIPASLNGNAAYASPVWPELAFAPGTVFVGLSESFYNYNYQAVPKVVTIGGHKVTVYSQHWEDSSFNGDGQLPRGDGNITGLR